MDFAIIGFGAAGTFAALRLREALLEKGRGLNEDRIFLIEKNRQGLRKVKISGGGRCNVTHFEFDPKAFVKNYPRGEKELLGPFHQFQAGDTIEWFAKRGVELKNEADGRMFPTTDSSQTIIDCFEKEIKKAEITLLTQESIKKVEIEKESTFLIELKSETLKVEALLLATGSDPSGHLLAKNLGHTITELAPSLFTFKVKDPLLKDLSGTSFNKSEVTVKTNQKKWVESGPLLITHWGLSGPAILKISAWAARELKEVSYKFPLWINFSGKSKEDLTAMMEEIWREQSKKIVLNTPAPMVTKHFWQNLIQVTARNFPLLLEKRNIELSQKEKNALIEALTNYEFNSQGSHRFKEEFVECGGVSNKEVNFKTMESKLVPGLYFAGEILDIDGITGGFNFQNAWTGGYIAGSSMANSVEKKKS